jgi:hypothetical protein
MGEVNGYICSETKLSMHTCEAVYSGQDGPFKILPAIVSLGKQFIRGEDLPVWKHGGEFEQSTFVNTIAVVLHQESSGQVQVEQREEPLLKQ